MCLFFVGSWLHGQNMVRIFLAYSNGGGGGGGIAWDSPLSINAGRDFHFSSFCLAAVGFFFSPVQMNKGYEILIARTVKY